MIEGSSAGMIVSRMEVKVNHDIECLERIWIRMLDSGLVQSKGQFSTQFLGKGASYMTSMAARDRNIPFEVFDRLAEGIKHDRALEAQTIEDLEMKLLAMLRMQKVRDLILSEIVDHQCKKSDDALDAIIADNADDTFFSRFLKNYGRVKLA